MGEAERGHPGEQPVQHVHGGAGVGQCPVVRGDRGPEERGQRTELVIGGFVPGDYPAREGQRVHHTEAGPGEVQPRSVRLEETDVEAGVVRHQHSIADELQERRQHRGDTRCREHHRVGDPGEQGDRRRDPHLGVHQGLELPDRLPAAHLDRADLGDRGLPGRSAGSLQVHHHEGGIEQRGADLVEPQLQGEPHGTRTGIGPVDPATGAGRGEQAGTHPGSR